VTTLLEHQLIGRLAARLPRSPWQINRLHESDAELVRLPGSELVLAITTDALAEEIATGLYADPWLIGWMLVTVNASDLAAVGADPLGVLICETLPPDADDAWVAALQRGIGDAAAAHDLPVLGGDTNAGATPHLAATAVGLIPGRPLTRCGARPGDLVFASGPLGGGGAYALERLAAPHALASIPFQPRARLHEGALLREVASACMDTSDGAIATLDELMTRNGVGFQIDAPVETWTDCTALAVAGAARIPPWMLHAGPHGEFELLFTVPPARGAELLRAAAGIGWAPLRLGAATDEPTLAMAVGAGACQVDSRRIRNLFTECDGDPARYLRALRNVQQGMTTRE
jgi:thiamine-monophosphate kinase